MKSQSLTFPDAFYLYFTSNDPNTGKLYVANRTKRWIDSIGFETFISQTLQVIKDEFPMNTMRLMLLRNYTVTDYSIQMARDAFINFVHNEYIAGR